ncbi:MULTISPECIES: metallophosphoesterase [Methylobacterium]|uniref:metallophosphoesterase n=1 Tax=Methylobacterium TaxID=407 RepID=UPI000ACDC0FC|nr:MULTISPECIES: metallophosphoesterase [unclassified Methylobacterium]
MTTYFTSDTHFGHAGMLSDRMGRPRPFGSREEHDEHLVSAWNNRVRPGDRVFHVGDFAYGCSMKHAEAIFSRLAGHKTLLRGNHEARGERLGWEGGIHDVVAISIQDSGMANAVPVWLSHYAHVTWRDIHRGRLHFYGHSHGAIPPTARACDVGVDCWQFRPVTVPEIQELLADVAARQAGDALAGSMAQAA